MRTFRSRQLGLITVNPALSSFTSSKEDSAINCLSSDEAKVVAFYPTLVTLLGFEYIKAMVGRCVRERRPYVKEIRTVKQNMEEYISRSFMGVKSDEKALIIDSVDCIFDRADSNIDTLWNTAQKVILKDHPDMDEGMLNISTNAIIALLFLRMAIKVAQYCETEVEKRTNIHQSSIVDIYTVNVINATVRMIQSYKIRCTPMMNRSVKAIARKVADELKKRINKGRI